MEDSSLPKAEPNEVLEVEIGTAVPLQVQSTFMIKSEDSPVISMGVGSESSPGKGFSTLVNCVCIHHT